MHRCCIVAVPIHRIVVFHSFIRCSFNIGLDRVAWNNQTSRIEETKDVNVKDKNGLTPLHWTFKKIYTLNFAFKSIEVIKLLIEHGANLNAQDNNGNTPLYDACWYGYLEIVQSLLNRGADVTMETAKGITPLEIAAERNHKEVVWFLTRQYPWLVTK